MNVVGKGFATAAATLLLLCGCVRLAPSERPLAERLAGRVRSGGSFYMIGSTVDARRVGNEIIRIFANGIASAPADEAEKRRIQAAAGRIELGLRLAGIDEIAGYSASSVSRPSGGYENRFFIALPDNPRGALWNICGRDNRGWRDVIGGLPADTLTAFNGQFHPAALMPLLEGLGVPVNELGGAAGGMFGGSLEAMLNDLSGEYGVAVGPGNSGDGGLPDFVLAIPDPESRLFNRLRVVCRMIPGARVEDTEIRIPPLPDDRRIEPVLIGGDGQLVLFSSSGAVNWLAAPGPRLADVEEFRKLESGLPERALSVIYQCPGERLPEESGVFSFRDFRFDMRNLQAGSISLQIREPDGMLWIWNGAVDFNGQLAMAAVMLPTVAAGIIDGNRGAIGEMLIGDGDGEGDECDDDDGGELEPEKPIELSAADAGKLTLCIRELETIRSALNAYADAHDGAFPAGDEATGGFGDFQSAGKKLSACPAVGDSGSYVYFGSWSRKSPGKLPLVIDRPANHPGRFNVLYVDGSIETHKLERVGSVKRIVGFLHTIHGYTPADFRELIRRADIIDRASGAI